MVAFIFSAFLLLHIAGGGFVAAQNECQPARCGDSGPDVRFPFWLQDRQPNRCGFPGFQLSCNSNNETEFDLRVPIMASTTNVAFPLPVKVSVRGIDYRSQQLRAIVLNTSCLPGQLPTANSSGFQFNVVNLYGPRSGSTLLNCSLSSSIRNSSNSNPVTCLRGPNYEVYAVRSYYSISEIPMSSCVKIYNFSYVPDEIIFGPQLFGTSDFQLSWSEPSCGNCEAERKYCRLMSNRSDNSTECFDIPRPPGQNSGRSRKALIAGVTVGVSVPVLLLIALHLFIHLKRKRDQKRMEKFLEDYNALRPARYSYADIRKITDEFKEKLGQGGYGMVYKGKFSDDIFVAVKVLNNTKGDGNDFINEVGTIGKIHHVNVVRLVGFCADGDKRALVYEFLPHDTLDKIISSGNQGHSLGWEKLLQIAVGIAKGIYYLHQGCNQRIVHFDIKPHNILLDQNFNPKVADFGLAKLCSKDQSAISMTAARGTIGYIAPEVFSRNFGNVSYKSDIYSFGMLLLDMVGGKKKFHARKQDDSQIYFPEWMYSQLEKGEEIMIQIDKGDDSIIIKKLIIAGLWCIQWYPSDRPAMKLVIQMLEGESIPIMPPNPFTSSNSRVSTATENSTFDSEFDSTSGYSEITG